MIKKLPALAAAIPLAVGQVFGPHDPHLEPSVKTPTSALVGVVDERQSHGDLAYHLEHGLLHRFSMRTYGKELSSSL